MLDLPIYLARWLALVLAFAAVHACTAGTPPIEWPRAPECRDVPEKAVDAVAAALAEKDHDAAIERLARELGPDVVACALALLRDGRGPGIAAPRPGDGIAAAAGDGIAAAAGRALAERNCAPRWIHRLE